MGRSRLPEALVEQLVAALGDKIKNISDLEDALEALKAQVGQQSFDKKLDALPPEDNRPKKCPRCQRLVRVRTKSVAKTFESLSGTHTLLRNYHYCDHCSFGFYPRDAELGLPSEGGATLKLESRLLDFSVSGPYERAAERWSVHYPHRPFSANMFRRVANRVGGRMELCHPRVLQEQLLPAPRGPQERLYVCNDGGMLPMRGGQWRESKLGVLVRETHQQRSKKRGSVSQARYVAVLGGQEEFKQALRCTLDAERWQRFKDVVWIADGARGNWTLAEVLCPTARQILDIVHAIENGVKCGKALLGENDSLVNDWQKRIMQLLYAGNVDALIRELMECWLEDEGMPSLSDEQLWALETLVGYYRNNQSRMQYNEYLADGLMIGSGLVESGHRHVLQERMKLSGQQWGERGGRQMAALRAAYRTAGPARFHHAINRATCVTYLAEVRRRQAQTHTRDAAILQAVHGRKAA